MDDDMDRQTFKYLKLFFNKTKYIRLRLSDLVRPESTQERPECDLSALDNFVPHGQTDKVTPWAPVGANNSGIPDGHIHCQVTGSPGQRGWKIRWSSPELDTVEEPGEERYLF